MFKNVVTDFFHFVYMSWSENVSCLRCMPVQALKPCVQLKSMKHFSDVHLADLWLMQLPRAKLLAGDLQSPCREEKGEESGSLHLLLLTGILLTHTHTPFTHCAQVAGSFQSCTPYLSKQGTSCVPKTHIYTLCKNSTKM